MVFTTESVKKLAHLSRLEMTDEACEQLGKELSQIVGYVERLQEVDVSHVRPMSHAVHVHARLSPDVAHEGLGRKALALGSGFEDGLVKVPKIIE